MSDLTATLNRIHALIEDGQLAEARTLLEPLLQSEASNPDVWWLSTHAAEDEAAGREALEQVLALEPDYPGAAALYRQITGEGVEEARPALKPLRPVAPPPTLPGLPQPVTAGTDTDDDFSDGDFEEAAAATPAGRGGLPLRLIGLVALVAIILLGLLLILSNQPADTPPVTEVAAGLLTPTLDAAAAVTQEAALTTEAASATEEVAAPATEEPAILATEAVSATEEAAAPTTEEPAILATEAASATEEAASPTPELAAATDMAAATAETVAPAGTAEITVDPLEALYAALVDYSVSRPDGIQTQTTAAGNTLVVRTCAVPGPEASRVLTEVMEILVSQSETLSSDLEAFGVSLGECGSSAPGRTIAVASDTARAYARGEIDFREFQRLWQPVD
ncbi:MAG: hypothetical protein MUE40_08770 [Anaerolineae bacterium]|nr:hypothetical protein [Anaerolineae bacterium]